jgi:enamine deaminase RidA (YjgF/YER057c/UK114 family)
MAGHRRINVASGRSLEKLAHYSRAVRVGDMVLQSGTTAIDRAGNVRGVGDVAAQVDAIMAIAEWSMGKAGGRLEDVVRSRIYVTDVALADRAARALARYFRDVRPASTLVQVNRLARPEQLIEIELDAVDGAARTAQRISSGRAIEEEYAYSRAVRIGHRVFISGSTALRATGQVDGVGDMYRQTRSTMDTILSALAEAGGTPADLVYSKTFLTELSAAADYTRGWLDVLGPVRPVSTLLGIPALLMPSMLIEIEAEAIIGASGTRQDIYLQEQRERSRGYARAVAVGDAVYVSGCTSISLTGEVQAPGDWAGQSDLSVEAIERALGRAGATLDDVVRRRSFTVDGAEVNRPYGQGPPWFARSHPASLGCRVAGLARPELLVEIEVAAVKGARAGIEWIGPDEVDPLDAKPARSTPAS